MKYIGVILLLLLCSVSEVVADEGVVTVKKSNDRSISVEISIDSNDPYIRELALQALDAVIENAECDE